MNINIRKTIAIFIGSLVLGLYGSVIFILNKMDGNFLVRDAGFHIKFFANIESGNIKQDYHLNYGQPYTYPPLFHYLGASFSIITGSSQLQSYYTLVIFGLILLVALFYLLLKNLNTHNIKKCFFGLVLLTTSFSFLQLSMVAANTYGLIACLLGVILFLRKKYIFCFIALLSVFIYHTGTLFIATLFRFTLLAIYNHNNLIHKVKTKFKYFIIGGGIFLVFGLFYIKFKQNNISHFFSTKSVVATAIEDNTLSITDIITKFIQFTPASLSIRRQFTAEILLSQVSVLLFIILIYSISSSTKDYGTKYVLFAILIPVFQHNIGIQTIGSPFRYYPHLLFLCIIIYLQSNKIIPSKILIVGFFMHIITFSQGIVAYLNPYSLGTGSDFINICEFITSNGISGKNIISTYEIATSISLCTQNKTPIALVGDYTNADAKESIWTIFKTDLDATIKQEAYTNLSGEYLFLQKSNNGTRTNQRDEKSIEKFLIRGTFKKIYSNESFGLYSRQLGDSISEGMPGS